MATGRYESYPIKITLDQAVFIQFNRGLTYQKCRFCGNGLGDVDGLWKYGIRHYICGVCRDKGMSNPVGRMSKS